MLRTNAITNTHAGFLRLDYVYGTDSTCPQLEYPGSNLPPKSEVSINLVLRPAIYKLPAQPFVKFLAVMSHRDTNSKTRVVQDRFE